MLPIQSPYYWNGITTVYQTETFIPGINQKRYFEKLHPKKLVNDLQLIEPQIVFFSELQINACHSRIINANSQNLGSVHFSLEFFLAFSKNIGLADSTLKLIFTEITSVHKNFCHQIND